METEHGRASCKAMATWAVLFGLLLAAQVGQATTVNGYVRFFGPIADGCTVTWNHSISTGSTATLSDGTVGVVGNITAGAELAGVSTASQSCKDSFTGQTIPYALLGWSNSNSSSSFQIGSTAAIAAKADNNVSRTAQFAYSSLGVSSSDWNTNANMETSSIFNLMKAGGVALGRELLAKDLEWIALSMGIITAFKSAATSTGQVLPTACNHASKIQQFLAGFAAEVGEYSSLSVTSLLHISNAMDSVNTSCTAVGHAAIPAGIMTSVKSQATLTAIASLTSIASAVSNPMAKGFPLWPLRDVARMAQVASYLSNLVANGLPSNNASLITGIQGAPAASASGICAAFGMTSCAPVSTSLKVSFVGPLDGAQLSYMPFTSVDDLTSAFIPAPTADVPIPSPPPENMEESALDTEFVPTPIVRRAHKRALLSSPSFTTTNGTATNPAGTHGYYTIAVGAKDIFLSTGPSDIVTTLVPILAIAGTTGTSGAIAVSPAASVVLEKFKTMTSSVSIPVASDWKSVYDTVAGTTLPAGDYQARNYNVTSATALAVFAIDTILPSIPTLGAHLISNAAGKVDQDNQTLIVSDLYRQITSMSASSMSVASSVASILTSTYTTYKASPTADEATCIQNVAAAIAACNSLLSQMLTTAMAQVNNNTMPSVNQFIAMAQVAKVLYGSLASPIASVASLIQSGNNTLAATASTNSINTPFTGTSLSSAVSAAAINTAAILYSLYGPPPPFVDPNLKWGAMYSGFARAGFGPVSAGCTVMFNNTNGNATTLGKVIAPQGTTVMVAPGCADTFTNQPLQFGLSGDVAVNTVSSFQVSLTTGIAAGKGNAPAGASYAKLGAPWEPVLDSSDVFKALATGQSKVARQVLKADVQYMAASTVITAAVLDANKGQFSTACPNMTALQGGLATYINSLSTPIDLTATKDVAAAVASFSSAPCSMPTAVPPTSAVPAAVTALTQLAQTISKGWSPLSSVAGLAKLASFVSGLTLSKATSYKGSTDVQLLADVQAATIQTTAMLAYMNLTDGGSDTTVTVMNAGPLGGAIIMYQPFTGVMAISLTTAGDGTIAVPGATHGIYIIPAGAVDTLLTTNSSAPVTTRVEMVALSAFPGATLTVGPISAMIWATYQASQGDGMPITLPTPADWKAAYETLMGSTLPPGDYQARTGYERGSATALAIFAIDMILPALPSLGGKILSNAINGTDIKMVVKLIQANMHGRSLAHLSDKAIVKSILTIVYNFIQQLQQGTSSTAATGRRLQQTGNTALDAVLTSVSSAIAASNNLTTAVLVAAQQAIATGTKPDISLFTSAAKVAALQSTQLATAIDQVAAMIASGDLAGAVSLANSSVAAAFTGDALKTAVASMVINDATLSAAITPVANVTESPAPDSGNGNKLAVGLGVGLGVGLAAVGLLVAAVVYIIKLKKQAQIAPSSPA